MGDSRRLIIILDMFTLKQTVIDYNLNDNATPFHFDALMEDLGEVTVEYAMVNCIDRVEIDGQSDFAQPIVDNILERMNTKYSDRKLEVYLNGEICN